MQSLYRPAAGEPEGALVLFHGRGADERDLFPLLDMLDPERRLLGATARGPLSLPPGGAHWYVVRRVGYPDPETFNSTYTQLAGWLDDMLAEHGIPPERTVLGGFSQGSVMSYALGLGPGRPRPAGIMALSGFLPTVEGFELDLAKASDLPVAIGHGTQDPVIAVEFGRDARDRLAAAGARVTYRSRRCRTRSTRSSSASCRRRGCPRRSQPRLNSRRIRSSSARKKSEKPPIGFVVVGASEPPTAGGAVAAPSGVAAITASSTPGSAAGGASIRCWRHSAKSFSRRFEMSWIIPPRPKRASLPVMVKSVVHVHPREVTLLMHGADDVALADPCPRLSWPLALITTRRGCSSSSWHPAAHRGRRPSWGPRRTLKVPR